MEHRQIVFFHPDLGIGGAERLVVDAAVSLQDLGHKVTIFTSHRDTSHCFDEARDGTLDVRVRGNTIVPPSIFRRFSILCAILRQVHLILQISFFTTELQDLRPDIFFVDQLSACVPLLRLKYSKAYTIFYCHFPDKLLAKRTSLLKRLYRVPFDWLESWTTGASDVIVVNSKFTRSIFGEAFPGLRNREPRVVYPCVDVRAALKTLGPSKAEPSFFWRGKKTLLSINRYERTKGIDLAVRAFSKLDSEIRKGVRLVIAGGYDPRVDENVSYHKELSNLANSLGLENVTFGAKDQISSLSPRVQVVFLLSVPGSLKSELLQTTSLLLYTPRFEHFGIVPLEAMLAEKPVLAANKGGPTETVVHNGTGWLQNVDEVDEWTKVMKHVLSEMSESDLQDMGSKGKQRVFKQFSKETMGQRLSQEIDEVLKSTIRPRIFSTGLLGVVAGALLITTVLITRYAM